MSKGNPKQFRIIQFERDATEPERGTKLGFEFRYVGAGATGGVAAQLTLLPARRWAISEYQVERTSPENTTVQNAVFEYPAGDPQSARPARVEYRMRGPRSTATSQSKLIRYEPWEVDESAFDPVKLGIARSTIDAYYRPRWYLWIWGALAPFSLLGGIALLMASRKRTSREEIAANTEPSA